MNNLKTQISAIAGRLTNDILAAVRGCTVNDIVSLGGTITLTPADVPVPYVPTSKASAKSTRKAPATRRNRLTGQDIIVAAKGIIAYVAKNPNVGAAQIQRALKIAKNQWLKVVTAAQESGLKKKGEKRSTVYYTGGVKTAAKKTRKYTKKGATHLTAASNIAIETPATPDVWPGDAQVTNGAAVEATA